MGGEPPLLAVEAVSKRYPGVLALDDVSIDVTAGEVHALIGENGAGKSTLVSVLAGATPPLSGRILLRGEEIQIRNPHHAHQLGLRAVFQHLSLVGSLPVDENLFLGRELTTAEVLQRGRMVKEARRVLDSLGVNIDPRRLVRDLTVPQRYLVEIAKASMGDFSILIFDEPTASLTGDETERLFGLVRRYKAAGKGIIWVTHRLEELEVIADRITVLRDGKHVVTLPAEGVKQSQLITYMTGRQYREVFPSLPPLSPDGKAPVLEVEKLSSPGRLQDVTFSLMAGEILGVGGLIGSGKSELGRAIFGLMRHVDGRVRVLGREQEAGKLRPSELVRHGVVYLPADRHAEGLVLNRSVRENISLASLAAFERMGILNTRHELSVVRGLIRELGVSPPRPERRVDSLSGGNQQKVMLARGLIRDTKLFILDEPTQGVDIGTKIGVYQLIRRLAEDGAALLVISSDLLELINLCHRVLVFYRGRVSAVVPHSEATEDRLLRCYFGEFEEDKVGSTG